MTTNNNREVDIGKMSRLLMILINQEYFRKANIKMTFIKEKIKTIIQDNKNNNKDKIIRAIKINQRCFKNQTEMVAIMREMRKS